MTSSVRSPRARVRSILSLVLPLASLLVPASARAADELARLVRFKLSAGDLASGEAAMEDYKRKTGVDADYLNALGWLARGAEILRRPEKAAQFVAELHREIPVEKDELLIPYGAAIEVVMRVVTYLDRPSADFIYLIDR